MKTITLLFITLIFCSFFTINAQDTLRNEETQHFLKSLKALTNSDYTVFGMANALTISYSGGPQHAYNDKSDCKDITGSHPGMIESDFMWYDNKTFMQRDTTAMREAYKKGAILGYCYHLRGRHSNDFYAYKNGVLSSDKNLVSEILASTNRDTNPSLDWYLDKLDLYVIPIINNLGFPIIYRPFHEMTGNWFWWGTSTCTPEQYISLYRLTVDYLRAHGVKNVLYAWAPDKSADFKFYPGDDYIDIIAYDGYDVGVESWHTISQFVSYTGTLSNYALTHDKVFAVTETGTGKYLASHPDYWFDHILKNMKKSAKAKHAAWMMTWYNADWSNNLSGTAWIPYKGVESRTNGQEAIDDFMKFYNDPRTIFLNDIPSLYEMDDSSAFIYPKQLNFIEGDSLTLMGGSKNNWFSEQPVWKSSDNTIATVDSKGLVKTLKEGEVQIIVSTPDLKSSDTCNITIALKPVSVKELESSKISIYPNPNDGTHINFDFGQLQGLKLVSIYNVDGKKLQSFTTNNTFFALKEAKLEPGLYIASVKNESQLIKHTFLVK